MITDISFSRQLKEELSRHETLNKCCRKAELHAFLKVAGYLMVGSDFSLCANFYSSKIAQRVYRFLKEIYDVRSNILVLESTKLKKCREYRLLLNYQKEMNLLATEGSKDFIVTYFDKRKCCLSAYLRAIFLHCGYVVNPEKSYHLEIILEDRNWAHQILYILRFLKLKKFKITERKGKFLLYTKNCQSIEQFLITIGSSSGFLKLEDVIIKKQMKNRINRMVNCETGNISRLIEASCSQIEAINFLINNNLFGILSDDIQKTALLRLENPEMSSKDLSSMLNISKPVFSYRMRRVIQLYKKYFNKEKRGDHERD